MSRSLGNVINPDDIVNQYGADTLRLYEMFMGPLEATKPWSTEGVGGPRRFLERVYRLCTEVVTFVDENQSLEKVYHQMVKKVTLDYQDLRFNTAISQMMIFVNECYKSPQVPKQYIKGLLLLLNPIAPHITEELNQILFASTTSMAYDKWPQYDESKIITDLVTVVVQVNGKIRDKLEVNFNTNKEVLERMALESTKVQSFINGSIKKIIVIPNKLVNIVC